MNKQEIMKRAHELAKGFEGHYRARLSMALRMAWAEAKAATSQPKVLPREISFVYEGRTKETVRLRLSRWTKGQHDRIYVDEIRDRVFVKLGYFDLVVGRWVPAAVSNPVLNTCIRDAVVAAARQAGLAA